MTNQTERPPPFFIGAQFSRMKPMRVQTQPLIDAAMHIRELVGNKKQVRCEIIATGDSSQVNRSCLPPNTNFSEYGDSWALSTYVHLEEIASIASLLPMDQVRIISFNCNCESKKRELQAPRWWHVEITNSMHDHALGPCWELMFVVPCDMFYQLYGDARRDWLDTLIGFSQQFDDPWEYGYVELINDDEVAVNLQYSDSGAPRVQWERSLNTRLWQNDWGNHEDHKWARRLYPVKGVFWGNIFGPELVEKLGGRERLVQEYLASDQRQYGVKSGYHREYSNGSCGFFVSGNITATYRPGVSERVEPFADAIWLWKMLREKNLMM